MQEEVTRLLVEWRSGDPAALEALLPLVYDELRRIAARHMAREREGHTLQATALVHEAWAQFAGEAKVDYQNRAHFLAIASRHMRQILVHHARSHNAEKRGAGARLYELDAGLEIPAAAAIYTNGNLLALDQALNKLAAEDDRKSRIVEMKYFGGLTNEEIAGVLGISEVTVRRQLHVAHAFLNWQLSGLTAPSSPPTE